jgi:hypothetical protein
MVEAYRSGSTVKNLAASYGIHRTTVLEHLKRQGHATEAHKAEPG